MADDWETDPDFINDVTEKEQRWGSKTVAGSGRQAAIDMAALRDEVRKADDEKKLKTAPKPSFGYGGKFGVEKDRMDKSAVGNDYVAPVQKHASQKDYSAGFGGKYGVQTDRQDKCAVGWDHVEKLEKHSSQKDYSSGFGGKYGVQNDRQDKSAVDWNYHEKTAPHPSQKDYSYGFGGKFGVQKERMDSSETNGNHNEPTEKHPSQIGPTVPKPSGGLKALRARFEAQNNASEQPKGLSAAQQRVLEEKKRWEEERQKRTADKQNTVASEPEKKAALESPPSLQVVPEPTAAIQPPAHKEPVTTVAECQKQKTEELPQPTLSPQPDVLPPPALSPPHEEPPAQPSPPEEERPPTLVEEEPNQPEPVPQEAIPGNVEGEIPMYTAIALYDYTADEDDELTFSVGELITEIEKIDVGWWKGVCRNKVGLFPANYVEEQ
ncbi:unnamed protein product [Calicophoron daubneyi]|uniref:SH3 domain-containing protein n=1 Tax=Calicophoron daubneyi TaxID=300641 RepID=A0AAV2TBC5_CALDB